VTGKDGTASAAWTLGDAPGRQRVAVTVPGLDSVLTLSAEAEPSAANTRVGVIGEPVSAPAGTGQVAVAVQLTDSLGRVLAGIPVSWTTLDGGSIKVREARSDSLGESRAEWSLGPRSGVQRARVLLGTGRLPGTPARLISLTGVIADGIVGGGLKRPAIVRVTDAAGNPVPSVSITVAPKAGSAPDSALATDSAGRAVIGWTLGEKAGDQKLVVSVPDIPPLEITARARPRAAANIAFLDPPSSAFSGRALPKPVRVLVTDVYGNPVAQQLVVFQSSGGTASPARVMTAKDGTAATKWTLARKPGQQFISATLPGGGARERLELEVAAAAPSTRR
jgi:hypothetical protein